MEIDEMKITMEQLFKAIPDVRMFLFPGHDLYKLFQHLVETYFKEKAKDGVIDFKPLEGLNWPCISVGNLNSYDLFGMNGFLHYSYLYEHRDRYKVIFDIGANIGLDSIVFEKFGYKVFAFEPDPDSVALCRKHMALNNSRNIEVIDKALSDKKGEEHFIRVKGNLTASHIKGSREYYGDADFLTVKTITLDDIGVIPDIVKINIEGFETRLVPSIPVEMVEKSDFFISLHGEAARKVIYNFFTGHDANIFCQNLGWRKAQNIEEIPVSNKEGYIFVSKNLETMW
ncbi:MAG: FkbM family methyltransferase [Desulfobacteraceae bacterium]|nr:FkbM family methyltransferase [Desulfobacteraceae bacterium]